MNRTEVQEGYIVNDDSQSAEDVDSDGSSPDVVDEEPDREVSRTRERDHRPTAYTTGYDSLGETRVGIGSAGGDVTKLIRHNEGRHRSDGNHSAREAARDKKRIAGSFCSKVDVTSYQQREVIRAMASMNLDRFGRQKSLEKVALVTIKVIVEWDWARQQLDSDGMPKPDVDAVPRIWDNDDYCELLDEHDVSRKDVYSVSQLVKRELKKCRHFGPRTANTRAHTAHGETGADDD